MLKKKTKQQKRRKKLLAKLSKTENKIVTPQTDYLKDNKISKKKHKHSVPKMRNETL